ncbi:MAG TPA: hypothetical protein VJ782_10710 [Aeromicrobium sp.]|nr:hypothetical protein [Aeromicrobium sp.]
MPLFRRPKVARDDLVVLREWVASHGATKGGVEAYVEPQTSFSPTTIVLVAGDGEFIRRPVGSPDAAARFARDVGIPVYDTNRVGLPKRMRDYALRQQADKSSGASTTRLIRSAREIDAIQTIARVAAVDVSASDASTEELRALIRAARAKVHPDRAGGRADWDAVDEAARILGLH